MQRTVVALSLLLILVLAGFLAGLYRANPVVPPSADPDPDTYVDRTGDREMAYLLTRLELQTRATIAAHYNRAQSPVPGVDLVYKRWLAKNAILPAAVADRIFTTAVPAATGGRAWVRMVVDEPRNPHNRGDEVALDLLREIREGKPSAERTAGDAVYYAEPITANATCLPCHGQPRGAPDPMFPQYEKNGWTDGEVVGAVVARVAARK